MYLSHYGPKETMDRFASAVAEHGFTILARIDHASAAAQVGIELRPTEVLIFGNPRVGTPLMQAAKTLGIDLPLKAMVWQDGEANTCVAHYEPKWLARRHGIPVTLNERLDAMPDEFAAGVKQAARSKGQGS